MKILVHSAGHTIIEYLKLEGTHKGPTPCSSQEYLKPNRMTENIMQMLLELCQASFWHHFPG